MKFFRLAVLTLLALLQLAPAQTLETTELESQISSIGLFKNGLAIVQEKITIGQPGAYELKNIPEPVHGTYWIDSDLEIETRISSKEIDEPLPDTWRFAFQRALAGKKVRIQFQNSAQAPLEAIVKQFAEPEQKPDWNRDYTQPQYQVRPGRSNAYGAQPVNQPEPAPDNNYLVLETKDGLVYLQTGSIAQLTVLDKSDIKQPTRKVRKPILILDARGAVKKGTVITITYLTKGITWAPGYQIDLQDGTSLELRQNAVIKNELRDITDAEIQLISGFPNVRFGHVLSLLAPNNNLAAFFQALDQPLQQLVSVLSNNAMARQQAMYAPSSGGGLDTSSNPTGEGLDIYYHTIGKRSLAEGEALDLQTAAAKADYKRIVEWVIPDNRDAYGRYIDEYQRNNNPEKFQDAAWDAICFANPFAFPMTTGAAMIVERGKFLGQTMSSWTNPGGEATLHVTKALSIQTRAAEYEEKNEERKIVFVGGNDFRETSVKGELEIVNRRSNAAQIMIKRRFSGELLQSDAEPKTELLEEGVYSVNRRNELVWNIELQPGETKKITYNYKVLVDN